MNTKPVLITGANGFVGSRLCECLIEDGWQVRRVLRRAGTTDGVVVGELGPETDLSEALAGVETVVHLAARVHVMRNAASDPLAEYRRVNVEGTLNLARQAAEAGVQRFVYLSSIKVNGEYTGVADSAERPKAFREEDVPDPQDAYAISKWEAEQGLMALARETGMEVVIIRPPLVYGPNVKANFLSMMQWIYRGIPLPLGSIRNKRSLVALDNLVNLIVTCIEHPAAANEIFLVSDAEDLCTPELIRRLGQAMDKPVRLLPVPAWVLKMGAALTGKQSVIQRLTESLQVDVRKARELLDWSPPLGVDEGLRKTARYFLEHHTK